MFSISFSHFRRAYNLVHLSKTVFGVRVVPLQPLLEPWISLRVVVSRGIFLETIRGSIPWKRFYKLLSDEYLKRVDWQRITRSLREGIKIVHLCCLQTGGIHGRHANTYLYTSERSIAMYSLKQIFCRGIFWIHAITIIECLIGNMEIKTCLA